MPLERIELSTDILGVKQNPANFLAKGYPAELFENNYVTGFEALAVGWPRDIRFFTKTIEDMTGIPVVRYHGPTGGKGQRFVDMAKVVIYENVFAPTTPELLTAFPGKEILIHAPEAFKPEVFNSLIVKRAHTITPVWIENDTQKNGLHQVRDTVHKLKKAGVPACGMLDLVHAFHNDWKGYSWEDMLVELDLLLEEKTKGGQFLFQGIHFPIGTLSSDSLNLKTISNAMLQEMAAVIHRYGGIKTIELENQINGVHNAFTLWPDMRERNYQIFNRLLKTGIIYKNQTK